jgi:hypothetical protein
MRGVASNAAPATVIRSFFGFSIFFSLFLNHPADLGLFQDSPRGSVPEYYTAPAARKVPFQRRHCGNACSG